MRYWPLLSVLVLAGCGSDSNPTTPAPVDPIPSPTPVATPVPPTNSAYAGNWVYRTTITAVDRNCGHTTSDIGLSEGPFAVTVANDGTFALPGGSQGSIDSAGNVRLVIAPSGGSCGSGTGAGGCRDADHCDGTSEQTGDVKKWTLFRQ